MSGIMLGPVATVTPKRCDGSLVGRRSVRAVLLSLWSLAVLAGPLGISRATAEPVQWVNDLATCYDRGVGEQKPIVMLLYDKGANRVDADMVATRLSLSPRIQAVASKAAWCFSDVSSDRVSRNFAKVMQIKYYPSVSVLAPNGKMIDETARVVGAAGRDSLGFQRAAEDYIIIQVEKLSARYGRSH